MRYDDTPTTQVDVDIAAPPGAVWELITDINLPARFSPEFMGAEWLDGDQAPRLGARFLGRNQHERVGEWQTTSTINAFEHARSFGWVVQDPDDPAAMWRFDIAPIDDGCLTMWAQMGPGPSGISRAIKKRPDREEAIVAARIAEWRRNMISTVEGIKAVAESR